MRLSVLAATNRPLWSPPSLRLPSVPAKVPTQKGLPMGGGTFLLSSFSGQGPIPIPFSFLLSSWPVTWSSFCTSGCLGSSASSSGVFSGTLPRGDVFWLYLQQELGPTFCLPSPLLSVVHKGLPLSSS